MALGSVLAQSAPSATTLTDAYTVPSSTDVTVHVVVANRSAVATMFRISVAANGAGDATSQYIAYDTAIAGNDVYVSPKITANASDVVRVYATLATLTFTVTGLARS